MLLYTFGGYEDFKEIFELREHGNGVKSRRNQILLAFYKSPKLLNGAAKMATQNSLESETWLNFVKPV